MAKPAPEPVPAHRFVPSEGDFRWRGVGVTEYTTTPATAADFSRITRQTLFGHAGEAIGFEVRYFEIAPGGWSSLECHAHAHAVIGLRGKGRVLLGDEVRELSFLDLAYIGPDCVHRLTNDADEPFGFLCVVDAVRDRPKRLNAADVPRLLDKPETADIIHRKPDAEIFSQEGD
jgi:quercetin dioxygenase-like cupin family protein